jgi:hypothetical protein
MFPNPEASTSPTDRAQLRHAGFSITDIPQDVEEFGGAPQQDDGRFEVTFQDLQEPMKLDEIERWLLSDQDTVLPWALNLMLYVIGKHMLCMM